MLLITIKIISIRLFYSGKRQNKQDLSCCQKSAVAIASVIAVEPDILAMDEPAANLDPRSRRLLINLLKTFEHSK